MKATIERWGNKDKASNNYIFPIFELNETPLRQYDLVQLFVSFINSWMKYILKELGINKNGTTYVARHTFSTVMKPSGASTEYIKEALGHSNIKPPKIILIVLKTKLKKSLPSALLHLKIYVIDLILKFCN